MNTIKQRVFTGWNFQRVIYVALGTIVMISAIVERQWAAVFVGGYFASMGLFAFGCAAGACFNDSYNKPRSEKTSERKEINFKEIK